MTEHYNLLHLGDLDDSIIALAETDIVEEDCGDQCSTVFWVKIAFVVVCFLEGFIAGNIPTWSEGCRTNPKILGVANAFAAGVFMAIALVHVMPEEIGEWAKYVGSEEVFPLPEVLCFLGYTMILTLDKVLFDTHALFDDHGPGQAHDPADAKLELNVRQSLTKMKSLPEDATAEQIRESQTHVQSSMERGVKDYLNPHDRFAQRVKRSLSKGSSPTEEGNLVEDQQHLFTKDA